MSSPPSASARLSASLSDRVAIGELRVGVVDAAGAGEPLVVEEEDADELLLDEFVESAVFGGLLNTTRNRVKKKGKI